MQSKFFYKYISKLELYVYFLTTAMKIYNIPNELS